MSKKSRNFGEEVNGLNPYSNGICSMSHDKEEL